MIYFFPVKLKLILQNVSQQFFHESTPLNKLIYLLLLWVLG